MKPFDIAPFALPNTPDSEMRFEELRDVARVDLSFYATPPSRIGLSYMHRYWPHRRAEQADPTNPAAFGWLPIDDWFNPEWRRAAIRVERTGLRTVAVFFLPLTKEFPDQKDYAVEFRRTLGLKVGVPKNATLRRVAVFTTSPPTASTIRVHLDCGRRTLGRNVGIETYNARVRSIRAVSGVRCSNSSAVVLGEGRRRAFDLAVHHMLPAHPLCGDDGHITFVFDGESFTISLTSLRERGPIWFAEQGVFITNADAPASFDDYRKSIRQQKSVLQMVLDRPEQSYGGAFHGQPRPHPIGYCIGVPHARQIFRIEPAGDIVLDKWMLIWRAGRDTPRFKNKGNARFFFGFERAMILARFNDPAPVPIYNIRFRRGDLEISQEALAAPLEYPISEREPAGDDTVVALVRFSFRNTGESPVAALLPIAYSSDSSRSHNPLLSSGMDDCLVPRSQRDALVAEGNALVSDWQGERVIRARYETTMASTQSGSAVVFSHALKPGETCHLLLKIPYIALDTPEELRALDALDFDVCRDLVARFWREVGRRGAQLHTPDQHLNALHAAHLTHVTIADPAMADSSGLINTSVGTATYGNYSNESCMIIQELDQRGLHDEARRRLDLFVNYQGTVPLPGNFTDCQGVFYGAGGFEQGRYNQHHGWVLWCLCEHYFLSGDRAWFENVAPAVIAGADWVFRQRRTTMAQLPHSRGWERGFLPAGSLEDVTDYWYWLSTNALTWRGTNAAACALEDIAHPDASRIRREADAYRRDLVRGFETMRWYSPLVRLRSGRWVPHYPSRLYCRGRDVGWIRETLEGSVYLLISGLYDPRGRQGSWILEDYQDNRYISPPFGYNVPPPSENWYDHGGISIQPCLLAGLMPHLDRDEPEFYLWMFFNAWCAIYREETNSMVEHPMPTLGYSNSAYVKTSDEANAVMWLRYLLVYATPEIIHFGRAVPRAWFAESQSFWLQDVATRFGTVGVRYTSDVGQKCIQAEVSLSLRRPCPRVLVRFRTPDKQPIRSVVVDGRTWKRFDSTTGDVDITGSIGKVIIIAQYS